MNIHRYPLTFLDQDKAQQGRGLSSCKWINFYLDNLGSNIYLAVNVLVIKKWAINFLVTGKGFCNLDRDILFNIIKSFTTPCIIFEDLRVRWVDKHLWFFFSLLEFNSPLTYCCTDQSPSATFHSKGCSHSSGCCFKDYLNISAVLSQWLKKYSVVLHLLLLLYQIFHPYQIYNRKEKSNHYCY